MTSQAARSPRSPSSVVCPLCGAGPNVPCHTVYYLPDASVPFGEHRVEEQVTWFHAMRHRRAEKT